MVSVDRPSGPRIASIALVVLVTMLVAGTGVAVSQLDEISQDAEPADEIIVEDEQVILVYENETEGDIASMEVGGDAGNAIGYASVESDETESNATGSLSAELNQSSLTAEGEGEWERPEQLEEFSAVVEVVQSDVENSMNIEVDALTSEPVPVTATSTGEVVSEANRVQITGDFEVESLALGQQSETSLNLNVTETSNGFVVDVEQVQTGRNLSRQGTEEKFRTQIEAQANAIAQQTGGSATVTVDRYSYESGEQGDRLDVAYTVEMTNVRDGFATMAANQMQGEENLTQAQRDAVEQLLQDTSIDTFTVDYEAAQGTSQGSMTLEVSGFNDGMVALLQAIEEDDELAPNQNFEDIEATIEAQEAADLRQILTWNVDVHQEQGGLAVSVNLESESENWEAYIEEAAERDLPAADQQTDFTFESQTEGDSLVAEFALQSQNEQLLNQSLDQAIQTLEQQPDTDEDAVEFLRSVQDAELNKAKTDVTVNETVKMEAGAHFENESVVRGGVQDAIGAPVEHVYVTGDSNTTTAFVYVDAASASEETLRETPLVDEDTEFVTRDERDPQRLDLEAAASYLGVELDEETDEGAADGSGPGFGVAVALLAVLTGALYSRRRE